MSDFAFMTAIELKELIARRDISPVDLVGSSLERMEGLEPTLNCFVQTSPDLALEAARKAEKAVMAGEDLGLLHGLPISVKDLIAVDGLKLTFGSRAMADNVAAVDAPSVDRARRQGACIVGKSTTSEFGCKAVGDSPLTGITPNAWNLAKTPGGSSCGAATSVAAGITPFALGTDGGGSVRIPSSLSGLFGIKAQFARVAVYPASATPTLAHVGPLTRTVRDGAPPARRGRRTRPARPLRRRAARARFPGRLRPAGARHAPGVESDSRLRAAIRRSRCRRRGGRPDVRGPGLHGRSRRTGHGRRPAADLDGGVLCRRRNAG